MPQGRFSAYPAIFGSVITISDVINTDFNPGISEIADRAAGALDIGARAMANQDPQVKLTCRNLAHLATISPTVGAAIDGQTLIQHQRRADGGAFADSGHQVLKFFKGFLSPDSVEASQDATQPAALTLNFWPLYDGTNTPITILSQALQGTPSAAPTIYRLGPAYIGGSLVQGNKSSKVGFGIDYKVSRANGELVAREGSIYGRLPTINLEPTDLSTVLTLTAGGQLRLSGNVVIYFQKEGVAFGTAQHVSFTMVNPTLELGNVAASVDDDPRPGVICKTTAGATISVNTATTIP